MRVRPSEKAFRAELCKDNVSWPPAGASFRVGEEISGLSLRFFDQGNREVAMEPRAVEVRTSWCMGHERAGIGRVHLRPSDLQAECQRFHVTMVFPQPFRPLRCALVCVTRRQKCLSLSPDSSWQLRARGRKGMGRARADLPRLPGLMVRNSATA